MTETIIENKVFEKIDYSEKELNKVSSNKINKAKFSLTGIVGLLDKYDIEVK